jgi:cytochrome c556
MSLDPASLLAAVRLVRTAARGVSDMIGQALEQEREEKQALKELWDSVEAFKSDTNVYIEHISAMQNDYDSVGTSFAAFIQRYAAITTHPLIC